MSADTVDKLLIQWAEERPDLESESLGIVVRLLHLSKQLSDCARDALKPLNLSFWEYDVLSALRRQGPPYRLSASELALQNKLSSGAMTNRIDRLESKGLVMRRLDANDRRAVNIELTNSGLKLIGAAVERRIAAAETSLTPLTKLERKRLAKLLKNLLVG